MAERLFESTLVMVEPLLGLVVYGTDINHDVACIQDLGVASAYQVFRSTMIQQGGGRRESSDD